MLIVSNSKKTCVMFENISGIEIETTKTPIRVVCYDGHNSFCLGTYSSKEIAINIIDDICKQYTNYVSVSSEIAKRNFAVFSMP